MKKKLTQLRWLVTMLLFVTAIAMPKMAWAEITPTKPSGEGTSAKPYQIGTAEELYWFAALVNGDTSVDGVVAADKAACAELTTNITVNSGVLKSEGSLADEANSFTVWTPISTDYENPYTGTFDGKGYTISGLYFNDTSGYLIGLFGCVGSGSKICNVGIVDSYFNGDWGIGGVCGYCISSEITNCYNTGTVIGNSSNIGGVCGYSSGTITDCYNMGNVSGTSTSNQEGFVGGVCGINDGYPSMSTITRSYNSGKVSGGYYVGGVCGANGFGHDAQIINCYNTGEVAGTKDDVGGICGYNSSVITTCYYLSGIAAGGINNSDVSGSAESKTAEQFKSGEVALLLNGGKTDGSQAWYQNLSAESRNAYPVLTSTGDNTVYSGYQHGETTIQYSNSASDYPHAHAYDYSATDEANGNHDKTYQGVFTWADNDDKTNATVTATFTCEVCGKIVTPEAMTVEHDDDHPNTEATCTEKGYNYYKTSYSFTGETFSGTYTQTLRAIGHNMNAITFNKNEEIYSNQCQRNGCGHIGFYATSDGSAEATCEDGVYKVPFMCLNDGLAYDSKAEYTVTSLEYKRTFKHDKWQAVYVPFDIDCNQISDDYEVATINNFHEYEQPDGSTNLELEVKRITYGSTIPALTPCLIRKKQVTDDFPTTETFHFVDVRFVPAAEKSIDCASVTRYYQFLGILEGKSDFDETSDFCMGQGALYPAQEGKTLSPQRWYLKATDRTGGSLAVTAQLRSIAIRVISDGAATGIEDIHFTTDYGTTNGSKQGIYDLQGRKLDKEPASGVYIKDGQKYVK